MKVATLVVLAAATRVWGVPNSDNTAFGHSCFVDLIKSTGLLYISAVWFMRVCQRRPGKECQTKECGAHGVSLPISK